MENQMLLWERGLNMEGWKWFVTFKWNCVKMMAWAFMNMIMNEVYQNGILHIDLLKDNIMLHFLPNKPYVVYINMCDWGEIEHMQKVIIFSYVFVKEHDAIMQGKCIDGWP